MNSEVKADVESGETTIYVICVGTSSPLNKISKVYTPVFVRVTVAR